MKRGIESFSAENVRGLLEEKRRVAATKQRAHDAGLQEQKQLGAKITELRRCGVRGPAGRPPACDPAIFAHLS